MQMSRLRRSLALVASAALLASLSVATVAAPASAAKPRCLGQEATIVGTNKGERIVGTNKRDVIVAKGGNDRIFGRGGNDLICGGAGADLIAGNAGADRLIGNAGPDRLFGGAGPDRLFGGVSDDLVLGGPGNDVIDGGPGTDTCYQNAGGGPLARCELPVPPPPQVVQAPPPPPPPGDTDGDGFTDDVDACPNMGDEGYGLDTVGCPLSDADILAVAWTETDGFPGYGSNDVLIARLMDTDRSDIPSIGDTIQMGQYPTDLDASDFGDWATVSHAVTGGLSVGATTLSVDSAAGTHEWMAGALERYREEGASDVAHFDDASNGSFNDFIRVQAGSPSDPGTAVAIDFRLDDTTDDPFIDVDLDY